MTQSKKILVIGAGIAGPTLCYWLKRFGFSPTLIEKYPNLRKGGQALDVRGVGVPIAKKMGIFEKIGEMRTRINCGRYVDTFGNVLHEEHGEKFGFRQDNEVEIIRGDLVEILMQNIADVPCEFNQIIKAIKQDDDHVLVSFIDGKVKQYDLVIGADGIYSTTRRLVFDKEEYKLTNLGAYISTFIIPNYLKLDHTELLCESNKKLMTINSDRDAKLSRVGLMFSSEHILKDVRDETEQKQFLYDTFKDFGWEAQNILELMLKSEDFYFDAVTQVKMDSFSKDRVALVGDAGYCASPLSGQGNNLAFVGAYILAGELKAANGDYNTAFSRYNELLRPFVDANQQFGVWVSKSFFVKDEVSKEVAEERTNIILKMLFEISNGITLPQYEE